MYFLLIFVELTFLTLKNCLTKNPTKLWFLIESLNPINLLIFLIIHFGTFLLKYTKDNQKMKLDRTEAPKAGLINPAQEEQKHENGDKKEKKSICSRLYYERFSTIS